MPMGLVSVGAVRVLFGSTVIAEERHVPQTEHVEGYNERGHYADCPVHPTGLVSLPEDFVLAPEARQGRDSSDCQCRNTHRQERPWDIRPEPTHLAHVLFAADSMNHRTCTQEQQSLEERMCH